MGLLDWLFDTGDDAPEPADAGEMVELPTGGGETARVSKRRYRDEILPDQLEEAGDDPEKLFQTIRLAVDKGVVEPCLEAAERLAELDPDPERSATLLGLVYWKIGRFDRAEQVYRGYLDEHGGSAVVLLNLAKVYKNRGGFAQAEETIWQALERRPNLEQAVDWWASLQAEKSDEQEVRKAYRRALREVADLTDAWYARARLAHFHLEEQDRERGVALARKVAAEFGDERRVMMLLTGPLGEHGLLEEMIELFADRYDPTRHGPLVGLNLVHACIETDRQDLGRRLLETIEPEGEPEVERQLEKADQALEGL